ncbi:hypothetical protein [Shimazuella kribbensis]|uniref:hypothetical protein n=1 Tax=Shimazuella kribbensis TaxID=139808 RepID=UPI00041E2BF5|nr:hypothetical protein [Shimazuella kribbensis]
MTGNGKRGSKLTRVTVNLNPRASAALRRVIESTGDSQTDCINHALPLYYFLEKILSDGGEICVQENGEDKLTRLRFF